MIIILSAEGLAGSGLSTTLANVSSANFGAKQAMGLYVPPLARNENLYLVARRATYNASNAPAVGDYPDYSMTTSIGAKPRANGRIWTVQLLMHQLEDVFPDRYNGSVHLAVAEVERHGACRDFAGMFKTLLTGERRVGGNVFYHPGATSGPIFPAGDTRWQGVRALPITASPLPISRLPDQIETLYG